MRKIKINQNHYLEPTTLADVTIRQLLKVIEQEQEIKSLKAKLKTANDKRLLTVQLTQAYCLAIASCSTIPYQELIGIPNALDENMNVTGALGEIIDYYNDFFKTLNYQPQDNLFDRFDFEPKVRNKWWQIKKRLTTYRLFDFGNSSVVQQLYFQSEWKYLFKQAHGRVESMDYAAMPKLIAAIAFPENELNLLFDKADSVIDHDAINNKIAERSELFLGLPLNVAYRCLDCFFFSCPNLERIIKMYFPEKAANKLSKRNTTVNYTL